MQGGSLSYCGQALPSHNSTSEVVQHDHDISSGAMGKTRQVSEGGRSGGGEDLGTSIGEVCFLCIP